MALPDERCQQIMESKERDIDAGLTHPTEGWARIDNTVVIYDHEDVPWWLRPILDARDDDGNVTQENLYDALEESGEEAKVNG